MKKSEFIDLLDSPSDLGVATIVSLQGAIKEFPYFQSAQVLLAKAFHDTENINFENQLKKSAAYAADRKKLHQVIFNGQMLAESNVQIKQEKSNPRETKINKLHDDETNVTFTTEEPSYANRSFTPDFSSVSEEVDGNNQIHEEYDKQLQQQILTEVIHHSILLDVDDEIPTFNLNTNSEVQKEDGEDSAPRITDSFNEELRHSFSDWLTFYSEEDKKASTPNLLWNNNTSESSREAIKTFSSNLPVKREFYSAAKMAKLSVQEDDDLITETLATIYAEQGHPEKAIKAFEKLQLKYPEKKVYFAGRIKEIENQLNSY